MSVDFSLVTTIAKTIAEIKKLIDVVSKSWMTPKEQLSNLKQKIEFIEKETRDTFPRLAQLMRSYSFLISEVKVVKALSDKASQLIQKAPDIAPMFIEDFISQIEDRHDQIKSSARQLPQIEVPELGSMDTHLRIIDDRILIIKNRTEEKDIEKFRSDFREVSTHYANLQGTLSQLLEKILKSFEA